MSLSGLFSSPQKQAQAGAQAVGQINKDDITALEGYVGKQQTDLRSAISGLGPNPYFQAAGSLSPTTVDPTDTVNFGSSGPGTELGMTGTMGGTSGKAPASDPAKTRGTGSGTPTQVPAPDGGGGTIPAFPPRPFSPQTTASPFGPGNARNPFARQPL